MSYSLTDLRIQIDNLDRAMITSLSTPGENISCPIIALQHDEIQALQKTKLCFSPLTWQLLAERLEIVKEIGRVKQKLGITEVIDEARKQQLLQSRVAWAPEYQKKPIQKLFEILHDISVTLQREIIEKNLQK